MQSRLNCEESFFSKSFNAQLRHQKNYRDYCGWASLRDEIENIPIFKSAWSQARMKTPLNNEKDIALYCYTLNHEFYKELNRAIREWFLDGGTDEFPFINYVKVLLSQVDYHENTLILYRGISNDRNILAPVDEIVYSNQFESCSLLKNEAAKFVGNGTLYKTSTKFAICIGSISEYPYEQEYIVPPGLQFIVTAVRPRSLFTANHEVDIEAVPATTRQFLGNRIKLYSSIEFINKYLNLIMQNKLDSPDLGISRLHIREEDDCSDSTDANDDDDEYEQDSIIEEEDEDSCSEDQISSNDTLTDEEYSEDFTESENDSECDDSESEHDYEDETGSEYEAESGDGSDSDERFIAYFR